ncbi:MAG: hypothetical protein IJS14_05470 [Lentisphaeria bacterium]|nr:hypothetical protein [Lentisphaeria bacterium]
MAITLQDVNIIKNVMNSLVDRLGVIQILQPELLPYGWRKAAKGRTVWRLLEEIIVQNLMCNPQNYGLVRADPPCSEVGVWDLKLTHPQISYPIYINIKSATSGNKNSKDDISKAIGLHDFFTQNIEASLCIVTFNLKFLPVMQVKILDVFVMPVTWLPDIYVNPSNNGNLQSSHYKDIDLRIMRSNNQFLSELNFAINIANQKKLRKEV